MRFNEPKPTPVNEYTIPFPSGVDFTNAIPAQNRSPYMLNCIHKNGTIETRNGYSLFFATNTFATDEPINGIWNIDANADYFIIHAGTKLYMIKSDGTGKVQLVTGLANALSTGIYLNGALYIFDGSRAITYRKNGSNWEAAFLDTIGYAPTTSISRDPDGKNASSYESPNLVSDYQWNSFLSDGTSTVYQLSDTALDAGVTVMKLNADGTKSVILSTEYSFTALTGVVTFTTAPVVSPVDGQDNIFIQFKKANAAAKANINKCKLGIAYGYDGNNNRIFVTGNPDYPNLDWFCQLNDGTYFPTDQFTQIGSAAIENYLILNDGTLAIQKKVTDTDFTVYIRSGQYIDGTEVFPIRQGMRTVGCIGRYANGNLANDPLTLSEEGVYGVTSRNDKEQMATERSYFIRKQLLKEANLEQAQAVVYGDKYHLAINGAVYVADSRFKATDPASAGMFQYEWFYWNNVPVRRWFVWDRKLLFGTSDGKIFVFDDGYRDNGISVQSEFHTAFNNFGTTTMAKTIKSINLLISPDENLAFELGYITQDGESQITTKLYGDGEFPLVVFEKEKIKKFMWIKFYIKSQGGGRKFNMLSMNIKYKMAGRYRGD